MTGARKKLVLAELQKAFEDSKGQPFFSFGGHTFIPLDAIPELEEETPSQKMKNYIERMRRSGGRADPNGNSALTATIVPPAGYRNLMTNAAP